MEYSLIGHIIGDVLGSPYEFRYNKDPKKHYSRLITKTIFIRSRFQGSKYGALGQPTDDTEMTIALLKSIKENDNIYDKEKVILEYMNWVNNGNRMLGRNTRRLFDNIKTLRGFKNRYNKFFNEMLDVTQSNGSLMRVIPICELGTKDNLYTDCCITNPNIVNIWISDIYFNLYNYQVINENKKIRISKIYEYIMSMFDLESTEFDGGPYIFQLHDKIKDKYDYEFEPDLPRGQKTTYSNCTFDQSSGVGIQKISDIFMNIENYTVDEINRKGKGWVIIPLFLLCLILKKYRKEKYISNLSFMDIIEDVVKYKGDTDTNAAIIGGLLGKWMGNKILNPPVETDREEVINNINIIKNCQFDSDIKKINYLEKYHPVYNINIL